MTVYQVIGQIVVVLKLRQVKPFTAISSEDNYFVSPFVSTYLKHKSRQVCDSFYACCDTSIVHSNAWYLWSINKSAVLNLRGFHCFQCTADWLKWLHGRVEVKCGSMSLSSSLWTASARLKKVRRFSALSHLNLSILKLQIYFWSLSVLSKQVSIFARMLKWAMWSTQYKPRHSLVCGNQDRPPTYTTHQRKHHLLWGRHHLALAPSAVKECHLNACERQQRCEACLSRVAICILLGVHSHSRFCRSNSWHDTSLIAGRM